MPSASKAPDFSFYFFQLKHRHFPTKEGFLLESTEGRFAEISPLEGRNKESLAGVYHQLCALQKGWTGQLLPSVAFGLYSLTAPQVCQAQCALLLCGSKQEILQKAYLHLPFKTAKLKIGKLSVQDAIDVIGQLSTAFKLRIDFNDLWDLDQINTLCKHIPTHHIEFFEDAPTFHFPIQIAYDQYSEGQGIRVYKPMVFGLPPLKSPVILSSSLESSIGLEKIAAMQRSFLIPEHVLGLGTIDYLEEDLSYPSAYLADGMIYFPQEARINTKMLFSPHRY